MLGVSDDIASSRTFIRVPTSSRRSPESVASATNRPLGRRVGGQGRHDPRDVLRRLGLHDAGGAHGGRGRVIVGLARCVRLALGPQDGQAGIFEQTALAESTVRS